MAWAKKMLDAGQVPSMLGEMPCYYNMLQWGNTIDHKIGLPDIWNKNVEINLKYFDTIPDRVKSGHDLDDTIQDSEKKAMIIVGASPILNDTWQELLDAEKDRFLISATNSSAKFLVEHGVIPDYVFLVDGQKGKWSLDIGEENLHTALICSPFAESETIAAWKGPIYVMGFYTDVDGLQGRLQERFGDPIGQAGNSFNCAVSFFVQATKIKIYLFAGNELSFKKSYYVKGPSINDASMYFYATDVDGEKVRTLIPLYQYKLWLENMTCDARANGYFFFNCSKGILGMDSDGSKMPWIVNADLKDALQQVRDSFAFELQDDMVKSKQIYDLMFASGHYWPRNGAANWGSFFQLISSGAAKTFTKGLDVGCGHGFAVYEMVKRGFDVYGADIAGNTVSWNTLEIGDRCTIAPAHSMPYKDNEFDFVYCGDVMEHIPEKYIEGTLREIARVGSDRFWFVIANGMDHQGKHLIPSHLVIGDLNFWGPKVEATGLKILHAEESEHHISIVARKETE